MKATFMGSMLLAALPTISAMVWPTLPISASMQKNCATPDGMICKEAGDILTDCYKYRGKYAGDMHECLCGVPDWKKSVYTCASCIAKELPAGVPEDPKNLVEDTKSVIEEYCKLPPNLKNPLEEIAFYGDILTTRYQSPFRFFNFEILTKPISSADSVHRHDSLKRESIKRDNLDDWPELQACYTSAECNAARGFWDTCFHHFPQQDSPYDPEHTWNCFCRNQGPETGPAGGIDGPWGRNATACNKCINNVIAPSKLDSFAIVSEYCYIQIGRFEAAAEAMVSRATQQTVEQDSPIQLLNYTLVL